MRTEPLGQILLKRKLISEAQLAHALIVQKNHGSRLGDILVSEGVLNYYDLYHTVAEHYHMPYVNLLETPPDATLLQPKHTAQYLKMGILPWQMQNDYLIIALSEVNEENVLWCKKYYGENIRFNCTSPFDIRRSVEYFFSKSMEAQSRLTLWNRAPDASAKQTLFPAQKMNLQFICLIALLGIITFPIHTALVFMAFCHVAYAATMLFKAVLFNHGAATPTEWEWEKRLKTLDEKSLPVYTVLIPMYKEKESIAGMLGAIYALDYPASKLDIKLVLESDDRETLEAAHALKPRYNFDIIRVPPAEPRTKPRACNYALQFARGEYVTVYDADDRPDKLQLKKAVIAFRSLPPDVVCLQARLNYYNASDNLLTRFFSLEYSILFQFMLYGLQRASIPIPLGGTSNHISLKNLKALGEWDAYNVTEDADLGARIAAHGLKTHMLDSYTLEEAPNTVIPWIKQRSRWIKGYMQTWLVHMRDPARFYSNVGFKGFVGFQFFVGLSCFTFLSAPIVWMLTLLWIGQVNDLHDIPLPTWLLWFTGINMAVYILTQWYQAIYCASLYRVHVGRIFAAALIYPLYLVLHSIASYRALWQLFVKPHFWDKTTHGLARSFDAVPDNLVKMPVKLRA
ncbi:MAG: glycosyltransferase [Alphaproteobacteria bacterium]